MKTEGPFCKHSFVHSGHWCDDLSSNDKSTKDATSFSQLATSSDQTEPAPN